MRNLPLMENRLVLMEKRKPASAEELEIPLYQLLSILKAKYAGNEAERKVSEFCLSVESEENKRTGLEFLYAYGFLEKFETLIAVCIRSADPVTRKWALLYQVISDWEKRRAEPAKVLEKISHLETDEAGLKCLVDFIHIYIYYEQKEFDKLGNCLDSLTDRIYNLTDPLLQELFFIRLDEVLMIYYWKRNELLIARKHGYQILNRTYNECKKADIHNALALGFIYDSYEQAIYHGTKALQLAKKHDCTSLAEEITNHTLPFIAACFGRTEGVVSSVVSVQAHLALSRGEHKTCIKLLDKVENLTPFQQFYLGKAQASRKLLEDAYHRFIHEQNDYFFARLPLLELRKIKTPL